MQGFQAFHFSDSDWARTSDLHPVKIEGEIQLCKYGINKIKYVLKIRDIPRFFV
jgi:hypothetical protein